MAKRKLSKQAEANFRAHLKLQRRTMETHNRKRTQNVKMPMWLYPWADERRAAKEYITILMPLLNIIDSTLRGQIRKWQKESAGVFDKQDWKPSTLEEILDGISEAIDIIQNSKNPKYPKNFMEHKDMWPFDFEELIKKMREMNINIFGSEGDNPEGSSIWLKLAGIFAAVFGFNKKQWNKSTKKTLGFPYESNENWRNEVFRQWALENYTLLRRYGTDFIARINEIVSRGVRAGISVKDIMKEIKNAKNMTKNKAKLLARDQVGKLTGELTKRRQTEAGINYYRWSTAKDERVRGRPGGRYPKAIPSHWAMEGKLCRWDDDSVYADMSDVIKDKKGNVKINWKKRTGKMPKATPGEQILCRCTAIPFMIDIITEVDKELEREVA